MASFELPDIAKTPMSPQLLVGATSPLWGYFGAAAAGGVAYWWMTQWARPVNVEALFGATAKAPSPALASAVEDVVEATTSAIAAAEETVLEAAPAPIGGESAPVSPLVAAEAVVASSGATETPAEAETAEARSRPEKAAADKGDA